MIWIAVLWTLTISASSSIFGKKKAEEMFSCRLNAKTIVFPI